MSELKIPFVNQELLPGQGSFYTLLVCKSCRASWMEAIQNWFFSRTPQTESCGSGIFVRENGATNEITQEEWDRRLPGRAALIWREIREKEVDKSIDDLKLDFVADLIMQEQRLGVRIDELEFQLKTLREERDAYRNVLKNSCFCWQEWNDNAPGPCNVCEVLSRFEKKEGK